MKFSTLAAAAFCASLAFAQFGGLINKAKNAVEGAKNTAKPVTDRAQKAADTFQPWSEQEEQEIGAEGAAKMVAMFGLVDDAKITRYVNLVGLTVAQFASRQMPYRFGVLDTEIAGAYALPGGYIFITRGALSGMTNEAQLAGALGHEIVHAADRHLESEIRSNKTSAWVVQEGAAAGKTNDLRAIRADAFLKDLFNTRISRDKEDSADLDGARLAAQAGYDPAGLLQFLTAMEQASQQAENKRVFGQMLATHPPFAARISTLRPEVEKLGAGATLEARFRSNIAAQ